MGQVFGEGRGYPRRRYVDDSVPECATTPPVADPSSQHSGSLAQRAESPKPERAMRRASQRIGSDRHVAEPRPCLWQWRLSKSWMVIAGQVRRSPWRGHVRRTQASSDCQRWRPNSVLGWRCGRDQRATFRRRALQRVDLLHRGVQSTTADELHRVGPDVNSNVQLRALGRRNLRKHVVRT